MLTSAHSTNLSEAKAFLSILAKRKKLRFQFLLLFAMGIYKILNSRNQHFFAKTPLLELNVVTCVVYYSGDRSMQKASHSSKAYCILDVLWGQPIKQNQVASTSELRENQLNDLLFFEIVPCHFFGASEVQT